MGKTTGFLEYNREDSSYRDVEERLKDYLAVEIPIVEEAIKRQAARCMDCGIPFCHAKGCSLYNLIPDWNDLIYRDMWKLAYERLESTNNFPEFTGRICPAPCEASCTLSINDSPVTIKQIELAIIEYAFNKGWVKPRAPSIETGKKIAVIGSGPSGLAAAQNLRRLGHQVTVYEKTDKIGGILRYGIPDFKLEKWVIDRRVDQMKEEGVKFETSVNIGEDISVKYLHNSFDAILLTMGAGEPRDLKVPGRELENIYFAMDYLTLSNQFVAKDISENSIISAKNKNVLVIGGGDTGSDCVGTANRQGAKKVIQFEILPKPIEWKQKWNPEWPDWPMILRTSSSHSEGCERDWAILTKKFNGKGKVESVTCSKVEWEKDSQNRFTKFKEINGSEFTINVDLVLLSMGFVHVEHSKFLESLGIEFDNRGNIITKENRYYTGMSGVFTAGDANIGASLVVRAIYHGREAAKDINEYLEKGSL